MEKLTTNRGFWLSLLLTIVTFGIYGFYLTYAFARETNIACREDGKRTQGLVVFILLSLVTFGIYAIVWYCMWITRCNNYLARHGKPEGLQVSTYLLTVFLLSWLTFGIMLIVVFCKMLYLQNAVNATYNELGAGDGAYAGTASSNVAAAATTVAAATALKKDKNDPLKNVPAKVISKRVDNTSEIPVYFIVFEFAGGRRERVGVVSKDFDTILEGDKGIFSGSKGIFGIGSTIFLESFKVINDEMENVLDATSAPNTNNPPLTPAEKTQKLKELEQMFYSRLISQEEYDTARAKLIG